MGKSKPTKAKKQGKPFKAERSRGVKEKTGGKNKKYKRATGVAKLPAPCDSPGDTVVPEDANESRIAYYEEWAALQKKWPADMQTLFTPKVSDERRAELFEMMAEEGEPLREKYSWAIPDKRAIRIAASFGPLVEVGAGKGYWAMLLRAAGVNVLAYDIIGTPAKGKGEKHGAVTFWSEVQRGGAEALQSVACLGRALFLCYPDEYEVQNTSLGLDCLTRFSGDTVIHVGELYGDCINLEQAPWGRTSGADFQSMLATNFHCILKVPIPSWPMSRDTLSVWRRTHQSQICYGVGSGDDSESGEDEGSEEVETWAGIPPDEQLPLALAAPCATHLL